MRYTVKVDPEENWPIRVMFFDDLDEESDRFALSFEDTAEIIERDFYDTVCRDILIKDLEKIMKKAKVLWVKEML